MSAEPARAREPLDRVRPTRSRPLRVAAGTLLAVLLVALVLAVLGGPGTPARGDSLPADAASPASSGEQQRATQTDPRAAALLRRADEAMLGVHWSGTQFVAAWSRFGERSALLEVEHLPGRGSLVRSSPGRDAVSGLALVPDPPIEDGPSMGRDGLSGEASSIRLPLASLETHYALRLGGPDTCAGRPAEIVEVRRSDGGALAARIWLDEATGLVLRREVLDERGRVVRASAYVDLEVRPADEVDITPRADRAEPSSAMTAVAAAPLREEGWFVPEELAGLELTSVKAGGEGEDRVVHLGYTDGLSQVSVFAQSGRLDSEALTGWARHRVGGTRAWVRDGVPQRVAWVAGGTVYTVLVDAPPEKLEAAVASLPRPSSRGVGSLAHGLRERMARGLDRVGSWVDPGS